MQLRIALSSQKERKQNQKNVKYTPFQLALRGQSSEQNFNLRDRFPPTTERNKVLKHRNEDSDSLQVHSVGGDDAIDQDSSLEHLSNDMSDDEANSKLAAVDVVDVENSDDNSRKKNPKRITITTRDERVISPEIVSPTVFQERRSQMTFAEESVADSEMRLTAGFAPGQVGTSDMRRFQSMNATGFSNVLSRMQTSSEANLQIKDTNGLLTFPFVSSSHIPPTKVHIKDIKQFIKLLIESKQTLQIYDGEKIHELRSNVKTDILQQFERFPDAQGNYEEQSVDHIFESSNSEKSHHLQVNQNGQPLPEELKLNNVDSSSQVQNNDVYDEYAELMVEMDQGISGSSIPPVVRSEKNVAAVLVQHQEQVADEEDDEYAAMMAELALEIDKKEVPPIIKQDQNIAAVLVGQTPECKPEKARVEQEQIYEEEDDEYAELMKMIQQDITDENQSLIIPPPPPAVQNVAAELIRGPTNSSFSSRVVSHSNTHKKVQPSPSQTQELEEDDEYAELMLMMEQDIANEGLCGLKPPPTSGDNPANILLGKKLTQKPEKKQPSLDSVENLDHLNYGKGITQIKILDQITDNQQSQRLNPKQLIQQQRDQQSSERNLLSQGKMPLAPEFNRSSSMPFEEDNQGKLTPRKPRDKQRIGNRASDLNIKESGDDLSDHVDDGFRRLDSGFVSNANISNNLLDSQPTNSELNDGISTSEMFNIHGKRRDTHTSSKSKQVRFALMKPQISATPFLQHSQTLPSKSIEEQDCEQPQDFIDQFAHYFNIDPKVLQPDAHSKSVSDALGRMSLAISGAGKMALGSANMRQAKRRGGILTNHKDIPPLINAILQPARTAITALKNEQAKKQKKTEKDGSPRSQQPEQPGRLSIPRNTNKSWFSKKIDEENILKNSAQISVLSLALKNFMTTQDETSYRRQTQLRQLVREQKDIGNIMHILRKQLHFAFLFSSPLVLLKQTVKLQGEEEEQKYTYFAQLDHAKEFTKIKNAISNALVQVSITKRQCTKEILEEILSQQPLGLHFSGHGILNDKSLGLDFYERNKDKGDFLVLEDSKGGSDLVSRDDLKTMINKYRCELQFVFVASCHSEFVGKIFHQAGATHVICIQQSEEVQDAAVIDFTEMFYKMLFEQKTPICSAFEQAKLSVEISFTKKEASIFKLLTPEHMHGEMRGVSKEDSNISKLSLSPSRFSRRSTHDCKEFGPFQPGLCTYNEPKTQHVKTRAPVMSKLRGRQTETYCIIDKLLNSKVSRIFTIVGWPGVGKSALVSSMLNYISARNLLVGGSIYINVRTFSATDRFIRYFNKELVQQNPNLFGSFEDFETKNLQVIDTLVTVLNKLAIIKHEMVLVIDNAEGIITQQRAEFAMILSMMLRRVPQLRILLTSQRPLQKACDYDEEIIQLKSLSNIQSANLFREVCGREIHQWEINQLLELKPDPKRYPTELSKNYRALHEHHMFTLLNGNPQSIILVASQLTDPQKNYKLTQLYCMLTEDNLMSILSEDGNQDAMQRSLKLSAQLSFKTIEQDEDTEPAQLLYLLALLPGGITPEKLDFLWSKINEAYKKVFMTNQRPDITSEQLEKFSQGQEQSMITPTWRRAFAVLERSKLAEKSKHSGTGESYDSTRDVLTSPEIVRGFASTNMSVYVSDFLLKILGEWFHEGLHRIYMRTDNVNHHALQQDAYYECFTENIREFVFKMKEKYYKPRSNYAMKKAQGAGQEIQELISEDRVDSSDSSSESEFKSFAEKIFNDSSQSAVAVPEILPSISRLDSNQHLSVQNSNTSRRSMAKAVSAKVIRPLTSLDNIIDDISPAVLIAHNRMKQKQPVLQQFVEAARLNQHPKNFNDRLVRAQKYWRLAFDKVKVKKDDEWKLSLSIGSSVSGLEQEHMVMGNATNALNEPNKSPCQMDISNQMRRSTFQLPMRKQARQMSQLDRRFTNMRKAKLEGFRSNNIIQEDGTQMNTEERVMLYHCINQILRKQYLNADNLIQKHFNQLKKCSSLFLGNIKRFQAVSNTWQIIERARSCIRNDQSDENFDQSLEDQRFENIIEELQAAQSYFRQENCIWGAGLIYFHQAYLLQYRVERSENNPAEQIYDWVCEAKAKFKKAADYFKKISHVRGCWRSYQHLFQLRQLIESAKSVSAMSEYTIEGKRKSQFSSIADIDINQNEDLQELSRIYSNKFEEQRTLNPKSELSIQRNEGDDYSLLTEIVTSSSNQQLFE